MCQWNLRRVINITIRGANTRPTVGFLKLQWKKLNITGTRAVRSLLSKNKTIHFQFQTAFHAT